MKPHALRLSAFGPFAGNVEVDLDALSGAGLFLLHGPTGAGKTTLLDGIGFALFGRVPGARQGAKGLRSAYAPEGTHTEVQLEVSFGARRFRITRSPDYERPKLRGTGTTTAKATVLLEEQVAGEWLFRSDRFDEAGAEIADLVGMSAEQFFQVVLLPQGEFARFLRATSEERAKVLQKLFATDRYADVEQWLVARKRAAEHTVAEARSGLDDLLARVAEVSGTEVEEEPLPWATALLEAAVAQEAQAAQHVLAATGVRDAARAALDEAVALAQRQARLTAALAKRDQLDLERPALLALAQESDAATRASSVAAALAAVEERRAARDAALTAEAAARAGLAAAGLDVALDQPSLVAAGAAAQARAGQLDALRHTEEALRREQAAVHAAVEEQTAAESRVLELALLLETLPVRREQAALRVVAGQRAGQRRAELLAERQRLDDQRPDVVALAQVSARLTGLAEEHLAARQTHVALLEKANDLRTASINTMIARLSFALEDETPCPVCGSLDHPDPSELRDEGVSADDEQAAREAADDAGQVVSAVEQRLAADEAVAAGLRERVGALDLGALDAQLAELDVDLSVVTATVLDGEQAQLEVGECDRVLVEATAEHVSASSQSEAAQRRAEESAARAEVAAGQLAAVLGEHADLDEAVLACTTTVAAVDGALTAARALTMAQHELDRSLVAAEEASSAKGFGTTDDAVAASRTEAWREETAQRLRTAADVTAAVTAELADPALDVELDPPAPVEACTLAVGEADTALAEMVAGHATVATRRTALERLVPQVGAALEELRPLQQELTEVRRLAELCTGQGANQLKMTLSSFVLAARLEEVAAAASVRLLRMTGGRYELVHTDGAARGGVKSGLGLLARDAWSGQDRETSSLSGGETFLASLALALGLADVVTAESGGTRIEALLVDEGFGSLDADTLDEVMDVLDGLREGGRLVGLVSHVEALKDRIPAQVEVRKSRAGSDLVLRGC